MNFFGYKSKFESIIRGVTAIGIGLVMLLSAMDKTDSDAFVLVTRIVSVFLVAAGIVSFIVGYRRRSLGYQNLMNVNAVVDIVLGIIIFFCAAQLASFLVYLIAALLIIFGAVQLIALAGVMSVVGSGFTSLLLSVLAIMGGIFLLFNPFTLDVMGIIAGVFLIIYGVQELSASYRLSKAEKIFRDKMEAESSANDSSKPVKPDLSTNLDEVKDVEYHKVDDFDKIDEQAGKDLD